MAKKIKLEPSIVLVVGRPTMLKIPVVVVDATGKILYVEGIPKTTNILTRQKLVDKCIYLKNKFDFDLILMEQNKLFLDKIDKYPDPYVLNNVLLAYGNTISIENEFATEVNILYLPEYVWKSEVLNKKVKYAIDLYKSHILFRTDIPIHILAQIEDNNYYETVCLSESILHSCLMNKKYVINEEELKKGKSEL